MHNRGSSQLRKGRYSESGRIYFITSVTANRRPAFESFYSGRLLVKEMMAENERGTLESLAYVVMPDHFHWLLQLREGADLSTAIGRVKSLTARSVNTLVGQRGRFWQDGFHDHALRQDEELVSFARYLVANPLRAGLVRSLRDYPLWDAIWL